MTDQAKPKQEGDDAKPVPSASMYIGLCQTRAQAAVLRWQYAIVFMALNGVVGGWCGQLLQPITAVSILGIAAVAIVMIFTNILFRGLVVRANQWIDYFTVAIEQIENKCGTETGVRVFSNRDYLSRATTQPLVRGFRFRQGIRALCDLMLALWAVIGVVSAVYGAYLIGKDGMRVSWLQGINGVC